jgi:transglutaminase-like putative cysteine protease
MTALDARYPSSLTIRVGCELVYSVQVPTPAMFILRPRRSATQRIVREALSMEPDLISTEETDSHGNIVDRVVLKPGLNTIQHDAFISVSSIPETMPLTEPAIPVEQLSLALLRYTQPSRYCESDLLSAFAKQAFAHQPPGGPTVKAIADWVHGNLEYRFGSGSPDITAAQILERRYGVCRDFAHAMAVLCRTFNIPTRYVTGHLPDVGVFDPGSAMDFHAYTEVYLANGWNAVDARFNTPRIGRIRIAGGIDAVDGAFATIYGPATLSSFYVWAYQMDPSQVRLGDPIDLTKRLDGTPTVRFPTTYER